MTKNKAWRDMTEIERLEHQLDSIRIQKNLSATNWKTWKEYRKKEQDLEREISLLKSKPAVEPKKDKEKAWRDMSEMERLEYRLNYARLFKNRYSTKDWCSWKKYRKMEQEIEREIFLLKLTEIPPEYREEHERTLRELREYKRKLDLDEQFGYDIGFTASFSSKYRRYKRNDYGNDYSDREYEEMINKQRRHAEKLEREREEEMRCEERKKRE